MNVFLVSNLFKSLFALKKSPNDVGMMFSFIYDYGLEKGPREKNDFAGVSIEIQNNSHHSRSFSIMFLPILITLAALLDVTQATSLVDIKMYTHVW